MNETQYYSATVRGETRVGFLNERDFWFISKDLNLNEFRWTHSYTDLAPVKFVPQDAVVIEGVTLKEVTDRLKQHLNYMPGTERHFESESWIKSLIAQLTPPKPRPAEPKGCGAIVEAVYYHEGKKMMRVKFIRFSMTGDIGKWISTHGTRHNYSDLIDPVVLYPGQVK